MMHEPKMILTEVWLPCYIYEELAEAKIKDVQRILLMYQATNRVGSVRIFRPKYSNFRHASGAGFFATNLPGVLRACMHRQRSSFKSSNRPTRAHEKNSDIVVRAKGPAT